MTNYKVTKITHRERGGGKRVRNKNKKTQGKNYFSNSSSSLPRFLSSIFTIILSTPLVVPSLLLPMYFNSPPYSLRSSPTCFSVLLEIRH